MRGERDGVEILPRPHYSCFLFFASMPRSKLTLPTPCSLALFCSKNRNTNREKNKRNNRKNNKKFETSTLLPRPRRIPPQQVAPSSQDHILAAQNSIWNPQPENNTKKRTHWRARSSRCSSRRKKTEQETKENGASSVAQGLARSQLTDTSQIISVAHRNRHTQERKKKKRHKPEIDNLQNHLHLQLRMLQISVTTLFLPKHSPVARNTIGVPLASSTKGRRKEKKRKEKNNPRCPAPLLRLAKTHQENERPLTLSPLDQTAVVPCQSKEKYKPKKKQTQNKWNTLEPFV